MCPGVKQIARSIDYTDKARGGDGYRAWRMQAQLSSVYSGVNSSLQAKHLLELLFLCLWLSIIFQCVFLSEIFKSPMKFT